MSITSRKISSAERKSDTFVDQKIIRLSNE